MKVKTDYADCEYVTAGKEYEVTETYHCNGLSYIINDDEGNHLFIVMGEPCAHLNDVGTWSVVDEYPTTSRALASYDSGGYPVYVDVTVIGQ